MPLPFPPHPRLPSTHQITTVEEASQFYPLFGLGANIALIFSGRAVKLFSQMRADLPPDVDGWGLSLKGLMGMVVIGGLLIIAIYYWLQRNVVPKVPLRASKKKKKTKMSVGESFTFLAGSRWVWVGVFLEGGRRLLLSGGGWLVAEGCCTAYMVSTGAGLTAWRRPVQCGS
jgi:hypothetical protein